MSKSIKVPKKKKKIPKKKKVPKKKKRKKYQKKRKKYQKKKYQKKSTKNLCFHLQLWNNERSLIFEIVENNHKFTAAHLKLMNET